MIGHYLLALTEEREDRVLTTAMAPLRGTAAMVRENAPIGPCLLQTTTAYRYPRNVFEAWGTLVCWGTLHIGPSYDALCCRFGKQRVNAAIRNRILSNRARRTLQNRAQRAEMAYVG